ncbi:transcriptional repressor [Celeribacter sp.]|uniref:transcriptional repressor n=1 Tax=Celeribacter sp. TaxID=1890673 RepID=UPI003A8FC4AD
MPTVGFAQHDHNHCVQDTVTQVEKMCTDHGLNLTPVRKKALEILLEEHRALGAYDVLERLHDAGFGSQPPVAYRALDFLTRNGFAHKVERLNAFIACTHPDECHTPAFLICRLCGTVAEAGTDIETGRFATLAETTGFTIEKAVIEIEGRCPSCTCEETA